MPDLLTARRDDGRDPYRRVAVVLVAWALLGAACALAGGPAFARPVLVDAAVSLGLAAGVLIGVATAQAARPRPAKSAAAGSNSLPAEDGATAAEVQVMPGGGGAAVSGRRSGGPARIGWWYPDLTVVKKVRIHTATVLIALLLSSSTAGSLHFYAHAGCATTPDCPTCRCVSASPLTLTKAPSLDSTLIPQIELSELDPIAPRALAVVHLATRGPPTRVF